MTTANDSAVWHLVGHFDDPFAGAELELLAIASAMARYRRVELWSVVAPHSSFAHCGVKHIQSFARQFPHTGVLVWGGAHVAPGSWLKYTRFERIVLQCNLASFERFFALIEVMRSTTQLEPDLVFVSKALQLTAGLPGRVIYSPMDISTFLQAGQNRPITSHRPVNIGRASRDAPDKHHPQDAMLYRMLAAKGWRVRIMGGMCLAAQLEGVEGIELLPAGAESMVDFYESLDIFFYRTGTTVDAYGRVVAEAMASGLPVVAGNMGGYAEVLIEGECGILVATQEEAWDALAYLANNAEIRRSMGLAGMQQAELVHGQAARDFFVEAYFGRTDATSGMPERL
jgi:glycosyltransferase involved in cell wall biosynthesis